MEKPVEKQSPKYRQIVAEVEGYGLALTDEERKTSLLMKEILPTLTHFLKKKGQLTEKTLQSVVCDALKHLKCYKPDDKLIKETVVDVISGKSREVLQVAYDLIYDEVKELTDAKDLLNSNEHAFYSVEYGRVTHRQIINICRNPFSGEPGRIDSRKIKGKTLTFDKEIIKKVGNTFEAITEIKILQPEDRVEDDGDTSTTEQRNFSMYTEKEGSIESNQSKQPNQNGRHDESNYINRKLLEEKSQEIPKDNINNAVGQNASECRIRK